MKKILAMLLAGVMVLSLAACGGDNGSGKTESAAPLEVLETVWNSYADDEKFAIMGGDANNVVDNAPGKFDVSDAESLDSTLAFPQASAALIDDAASMVHMMNANTFTAGAYHVTDVSEVEMLAADIEDNIDNRQWMCGFPETLLIAQIGEDTIVTAYGAADLMEIFKTKLTAAYENAEILTEKSLME